MKKTPTNMRVLFLAALAATVYGDGHELVCDTTCVGAVYAAVAGAMASPIGATYVDGDMAVYAFALYKGYAHGGAAGALWVDEVITALAGADVCNNDGKKDSMVECFESATDDDITPITDWLATVTAEEKAGYEFVLGALANQLAPGSKPALEWGGLDSATFDAALKVFYTVDAFANTINPMIDFAFGAGSAGATTCYEKLYSAIEYDAAVVGKQDLAYAIGAKGEKLFGDEGLKNVACFGEGTTATVTAGTVTLGDGSTKEVTDIASILTATDASLTSANAGVASALEVKAAQTNVDDTSSAAAVSALIATIALML